MLEDYILKKLQNIDWIFVRADECERKSTIEQVKRGLMDDLLTGRKQVKANGLEAAK